MDRRELNGKRNASLRVSEAMGLISPLINIGQFKVDTARVLDDYHMNIDKKMKNSPEEIAKEMETNVETVKELQEVCSPSRLKCPREEEIVYWNDIKGVPNDTGLASVNAWVATNEKKLYSTHTMVLKSKYTEYSCLKELEGRKIKPKDKNDIVKSPETVLTVCVNFPRSYRRFKHCAVNFRVLGSQKLCELRDKIACPLDEQPIGKFTDNPDHPHDIKCKHIFKSGFFFIENIFFDDKRDANNSELSKHILDWASTSDIRVPHDMQCVRMEDYTFDDLNLRLGSPYLYMHQGDCEHIIIFKDIRILHPDDCRARSSYPLAISRARFKTITCKVCDTYFAVWMTRFDELSDEDPSFFCDYCFRKLHYHKDGSKVAEFDAFPFINREEMVY